RASLTSRQAPEEEGMTRSSRSKAGVMNRACASPVISRLGLLALLALVAITAMGGVTSASGATTIAVDCTADPSALTTALATANDGDSLAIQGTCMGTFELSRSLTLAGSGGAALDGQGAGTVLTVDPGKTVAVSNVTITGGHLTVTATSGAGGIQNRGT